jgi:hypothetical protein
MKDRMRLAVYLESNPERLELERCRWVQDPQALIDSKEPIYIEVAWYTAVGFESYDRPNDEGVAGKLFVRRSTSPR